MQTEHAKLGVVFCCCCEEHERTYLMPHKSPKISQQEEGSGEVRPKRPHLAKLSEASSRQPQGTPTKTCKYLVTRLKLGRCPSTVRPVFPMLVFQISKQQNRTRTTSLAVLGTPLNRTRTKKFLLEELWGGCFLSWVLNWESTEYWDFHRLEPYTEQYSDTSGEIPPPIARQV